MSSSGRSTSQLRIAWARYPTTITNFSMPAACDDSTMCSIRGAPKRGTRGLGALPEREAIRLPLPAARIRHSLTAAIDHLDEFLLARLHGWEVPSADARVISGDACLWGE